MDDSGEDDGPVRHPSDDDEDRLKLPMSPGPRPDSSGDGQGSRCHGVPRGTCGSQKRSIETRGDPVVQGADKDFWARAVELEATPVMEEIGAAQPCTTTLPPSTPCLLNKSDWYLIPPDRTTLRGMAAEKFLLSALHYILKCDVDIRKNLYANVVLHRSVRVIGERMTENSLHRLPCRPEK